MKNQFQRLLYFFRRVLHQLQEQQIHIVAGVAFFLLGTGSALFSVTEDMNLVDSLWWAVVTMTTVGYGDISPASMWGKLVGVVLMLSGIGIVGLFTATIASVFVENKLLEHKGMRTIFADEHIVICGWNSQGVSIIKELRADAKTKHAEIVVLANLEQAPVFEEGVSFVRGILDGETIERSNLYQATTAILLSDDSVECGYRDAKMVMDILLLRKECSSLYICAELSSSDNTHHALQAGANEVVVVSELRSKLLAQAALDHGITDLVSELVTNRYGSVFYKTELPEEYSDKKFFDVFCEMKRDKNITCLGVQKGSDNSVITNPKEDFLLQYGDSLLVVAENRESLI